MAWLCMRKLYRASLFLTVVSMPLWLSCFPLSGFYNNMTHDLMAEVARGLDASRLQLCSIDGGLADVELTVRASFVDKSPEHYYVMGRVPSVANSLAHARAAPS